MSTPETGATGRDTITGPSAEFREVTQARWARLHERAAARRENACKCGDCHHPAFGPNTDGDPCDWCRDCGCPSADHEQTSPPGSKAGR